MSTPSARAAPAPPSRMPAARTDAVTAERMRMTPLRIIGGTRCSVRASAGPTVHERHWERAFTPMPAAVSFRHSAPLFAPPGRSRVAGAASEDRAAAVAGARQDDEEPPPAVLDDGHSD